MASLDTSRILPARYIPSLVAMLLSVFLTSCNGSGGGTTIFFGSNGSGSCRTLTVRIHVDSDDVAGQAPQACVLDQALGARGCSLVASFRDDALEVNVLDCDIPASGNLFSCSFRDIEPVNVQRLTESLCGCEDRPCDAFPPICAASTADPTACETCDNAVDDDGNGTADCADDNCRHIDPCATTTTTSTTTTTTSTSTSSTTTTTVSTSSTTTTTIDAAGKVAIDFDILSASGLIGALQVAVDYSDAAGDVVGTGGDPDCTSHVPGSIVSFNDDDANDVLRMAFVSLAGVEAPARLATCRFAYLEQEPQTQDFDLVVEDASDPNFNPIEVNVDPEVIPLPPTTTSTTTTSTSTTLTEPDEDLYTIYFDLKDTTDEVGAIQFDVNYAGSPGHFVGSAGSVECFSRVGTNRAFNDQDQNKILSLGIVSLNGFDAPVTLARCRYESPDEAPLPKDFPITIVDASNPDFEPITPTIKVRVSDQP